MKKIAISLLFLGLGANLFAQSVNENIQNVLKEISGFDTKVISVDKLKSVNGVSVAILEDASEQRFPIFVSNDGKSVWALSQFFKFSDESDNELIMKKISELEGVNDSLKNTKIDDMLKSLPREGFVNINAKIKTDKLLTIVTDPDCPYCRKDLEQFKNHLQNANVRVVFAPVHDQRAFVKSQLIINETKSMTDSDKIIAVFEKYYKDIPLTDEQMKLDTTVVERTTNVIFGSGLIRGVPYVHEGTK